LLGFDAHWWVSWNAFDPLPGGSHANDPHNDAVAGHQQPPGTRCTDLFGNACSPGHIFHVIISHTIFLVNLASG
ncbi:hypothetical protein DPEC_G00356200, partial [Dallia pectoralis]